MHKLDRSRVAEPVCLGNCDHRTQNWNVGNPPLDKAEIRQALEGIQGERCAYCEAKVYSDGHIEHFRRKRDYPQFCFDWNNLFLSCGSDRHCGHYKDRNGAPAYDPADIIKPDEEDPDQYFYFHSSGEVRVRSRISGGAQARAEATIRVFNLGEPALEAARERSLRAYLRRSGQLVEDLMEFDEADRKEFIRDEIEQTKDEEHCTVIRHFFEKL